MDDFLARSADVPTITALHRTDAATRMRASMEWVRRRLLLWIGAPTAIVLIAAGAAYYWRFERFIVSTDDAYVQADSTTVASRVSGYVSAVMIEDHQSVNAGQNITVQAGMKISIQAGLEIELTASGNTITLGPSGISISSPAGNRSITPIWR